MSTPDNSDTFEQKVNTVVSQFTTGEDGKLALPDGVEVDEATLFAARAEKRRRDTQASFTKTQQENKRLQAENDKLVQSWEQDAMSQLPAKEQARLEELKHQDPDAWRTELATLEETQRSQFQERRETITKEVSQMTELEQREYELNQFQESNPDIVLNDDVLANDIPPRITKKLETGEISFADFLGECKTFLSKGKTIDKGPTPDKDPGFAEARGGSKPSKEALEAQNSADYQNELY